VASIADIVGAYRHMGRGISGTGQGLSVPCHHGHRGLKRPDLREGTINGDVKGAD
jgi:hypothetical protein